MADDDKLDLVVEVDANKANTSIKRVNNDLSSMEQAATNAVRGASGDRWTHSQHGELARRRVSGTLSGRLRLVLQDLLTRTPLDSDDSHQFEVIITK